MTSARRESCDLGMVEIHVYNVTYPDFRSRGLVRWWGGHNYDIFSGDNFHTGRMPFDAAILVKQFRQRMLFFPLVTAFHSVLSTNQTQFSLLHISQKSSGCVSDLVGMVIIQCRVAR